MQCSTHYGYKLRICVGDNIFFDETAVGVALTFHMSKAWYLSSYKCVGLIINTNMALSTQNSDCFYILFRYD